MRKLTLAEKEAISMSLQQLANSCVGPGKFQLKSPVKAGICCERHSEMCPDWTEFHYALLSLNRLRPVDHSTVNKWPTVKLKSCRWSAIKSWLFVRCSSLSVTFIALLTARSDRNWSADAQKSRSTSLEEVEVIDSLQLASLSVEVLEVEVFAEAATTKNRHTIG